MDDDWGYPYDYRKPPFGHLAVETKEGPQFFPHVLRHEGRHQAAEAQMRQNAAAAPEPIARGTRVGGTNDVEDMTWGNSWEIRQQPWLVGCCLNPKNMSSSIGMMKFPILMGK